jgi:hypothetical protein
MERSPRQSVAEGGAHDDRAAPGTAGAGEPLDAEDRGCGAAPVALLSAQTVKPMRVVAGHLSQETPA